MSEALGYTIWLICMAVIVFVLLAGGVLLASNPPGKRKRSDAERHD